MSDNFLISSDSIDMLHIACLANCKQTATCDVMSESQSSYCAAGAGTMVGLNLSEQGAVPCKTAPGPCFTLTIKMLHFLLLLCVRP